MYHFTCLVCVIALCLAVASSPSAMADDQPGAKAAETPKAKVEADAKPKLADRVYVKMTTSMGEIVLELNPEKAPISVANFLEYADEGFYDGTIFHRVINRFMIQGGGFDKDMNKKQTRPGIKNEWQNGLKNLTGTIAMARLGGQADSATSQFFINVNDNRNLDTPQPDGAAYAVFGKVISGMDVVNAIKQVKTGTVKRYQNVPLEQIVIESVVRVEKEKLADLIAKAEAEEKERMKKEEAAEKARKEKAAGAEAKMFQEAMAFLKSHEVDTSKGSQSESGLWHVDVVEGTGASPAKTDTVEVHYTGWTTDGNKFDSSRDRGQSISFALSGVIKGWTEGVGGMKVGGKRWLVIPGDLAYGPRGNPRAKIAPNATLIFEVELLGIK